MKYYIYLTLLLSLLSFNASARPVSYSGGTTLMQMNDAIANTIHLHYSPTYRYSVGYRAENFRIDETVLQSAQLNYLTKRWNQKESQGNLYVRSNIGDAYHAGEREIFASAGVMADFETRRYFISYENSYYRSQDKLISMFAQKARIGVAPYVANYGHLHSWIMLQVQHQPQYNGDNQIITTPLIRVFQGPYLAEFGISSNQRVLFNFIARF